MNTFLEAIRFSRPYLARYWPRFTIGILLGILFGASNGLFLGGVYTLVHRVASPDQVAEVTEKGREAKAAQKEAKEATAENPTLHSLKVRGATLKEDFYLLINPWLPVRGQPLDWKRFIGGFLFLPFIIILRGALGYGSSYLLAWSGQRITSDVKIDAFRKVSSLSLDFFQKTTTSELIGRIEADGGTINNFLKLGLSDLVKEPSSMLFLLIGMLVINWKFTVIALIFTPLCIIPTRLVTRKIKDLGRKDFAANVGQGSITLESFQNVRITKAYALEETHAEIFRKTGLRSASFNMKQTQSREMLGPIVQTISAMGISAVLIYAVGNNFGLDTIVTFIAALFAFSAPVKKLNHIGVYFSQLSVSLERLIALFQIQPSVREVENPVAMPPFSRSLDFRHVGFSYGDGPVLDDINFSLQRGQRLGLAGESGSGKSSLINLVFRFYDPTGGQVEIDGLPYTQLRFADLRAQLAFVSQDILLFNATVAENIAMGKIGATREQVIAAAREAYAHEFIEALPQGYDTPLGERGQRLSGGQRQRIAIARAFVRNAPILVLDEATASLDSQAEAEVQKAIDRLAENRTVICVAHRLSTLRSMDRILVLEKGRIVEQGSFDQLLAQRGRFTAMAARQSIFPQAA
jgi:ABC-type multidrug transport system fused ATPase/permease subunit